MRKLLTVALAAALLAGVPAATSRATGTIEIATPIVTGPITWEMGDQSVRGYPWNDLDYEVDSIDYVVEEFFVEGTARTFTTAADPAEYKTRILVIRPDNGAAFSGTTIVEWDNVTAQAAFDPIWDWTHTYVLSHRHAFVYASVQKAGHEPSPLSHKGWDPLRYQTLKHPGDDFAYDIYSQIGKVVRDAGTNAVDPMGDLDVQHVIAAGQSQSAGRLKTYIDAVQPQIVPVFDGFLVDAGGSKAFTNDPEAPVIHLLSEDGLSAVAPSFGGEVRASENYRLWEVPGASHNDSTTPEHRPVDGRGNVSFPKKPYEEEEALHRDDLHYGEEGPSPSLTCSPIFLRSGNEYPRRYVDNAALDWLHRWVAAGEEAPQPPRVDYEGGTIVRDDFGHPTGGIRLPPLDVPVARYQATACALFGTTVPLDPVTLGTLYPTHQDYVDAMATRTVLAVNAGVLLQEDADELMHKAAVSLIPGWPPPESPLS